MRRLLAGTTIALAVAACDDAPPPSRQVATAGVSTINTVAPRPAPQPYRDPRYGMVADAIWIELCRPTRARHCATFV